MDRTLRLSTEQKCYIAQREIEAFPEKIEKLREESEKVADTYKASTFRNSVSSCQFYVANMFSANLMYITAIHGSNELIFFPARTLVENYQNVSNNI